MKPITITAWVMALGGTLFQPGFAVPLGQGPNERWQAGHQQAIPAPRAPAFEGRLGNMPFRSVPSIRPNFSGFGG